MIKKVDSKLFITNEECRYKGEGFFTKDSNKYKYKSTTSGVNHAQYDIQSQYTNCSL